VTAKQQVRGPKPRVHAETVRRLERATGTLGTAAIAAMDERLPWFRKMSAENRSWLGLVAQAGIAAFLDWIRHPQRNRPAVTEVFGTAPRELARAVSLQHAVEMVRGLPGRHDRLRRRMISAVAVSSTATASPTPPHASAPAAARPAISSGPPQHASGASSHSPPSPDRSARPVRRAISARFPARPGTSAG
jgi:hypothetical protein